MGANFNPGWEAGLELQMGRQNAVTRLRHMRHWGPLRVQRPFYPGDNGECHLYLLHPPGGMVTGDRLAVNIRLQEAASALLTTPSAGKIYRGNQTSDSQSQKVVINLEGESFLQWMPLETIVFDGARGELALRINLDNSSHCALWDIVCLGRPASGESFDQGYLRQRVEIYRDGLPLYVESNCFVGGSDILTAPWGVAHCTLSGTFLVTCQLGTNELDEFRHQIGAGSEQEMIAVSQMDEVLAIRYLGDSAENCRKRFLAAWRYLKPRIQGEEFLEPRIWHT